MNRCMTVEDGVKIALDIYSYKLDKKWKYCPANTQEYTDKLWIDGEEFPLFWWRKDTQIDSLYQLAPERKPCSMKLSRVCSKKIGLEKLLYKELDISEYVLRSEIKSVMSFRNGQSMNMLATMHNACISSFELAATLNENTVEQGRHFLWGEDGMISDKVVSQKITSEAVYLFTEEEEKPEVYNDIFIYMYGLEKADVCRAVMIAQILMGQVSISDWKSRDKHYTKCITAVADSNKMGKKIYVEEV